MTDQPALLQALPSLQIRVFTGVEQRLDESRLGDLDLTQLLEVRRPIFHPSMTNRPSKLVPPQRSERGVWCESFLERDHLVGLMLRERVRFLMTQPALMIWSSSTGRTVTHVPDALWVGEDGNVGLLDISTAEDATRPKKAIGFMLTGWLAERHGWRYEVFTEMDLTAQQRITQRALHGYRHDVPRPTLDRWLETLDQLTFPCRFGEVAARLSTNNVAGRAAVCHLIATGCLRISLTQAVSDRTVVQRS